MKELLECKDLLKNGRVKAAAKGLGVRLINRPQDAYHWSRPIEKVAFEMRDACHQNDMILAWAKYLCNETEKLKTPTEWIAAAVLAWESYSKGERK